MILVLQMEIYLLIEENRFYEHKYHEEYIEKFAKKNVVKEELYEIELPNDIENVESQVIETDVEVIL